MIVRPKSVSLYAVLLLLFVAFTPSTCFADSFEDALGKLKKESLSLGDVEKLAGKDGFKVYAHNPVLASGKPGEWDAGAIGSATVTFIDDVFHMYYEAWGLQADDPDGVDYSTLQIGHAISFDAIHWIKDPTNPVVPKGKEGEWDNFGTWDPYIIVEDGIFKLWYGGSIHPECDWGYAESKDGSQFTKRGRLSELNHVEDDHIVHDPKAGKYYMYYWDRQYEPKGLFRAESTDETSFDFAHAIPVTIEGDDEHPMNKFTHVVREDGKWYMFYADFVRPGCDESYTRLATSDDGIHWRSVNRRLFEGHDADVVRVGDSLWMAYYGPRGHFDQLNSDVRLAIYKGMLADLVEPPE